MLVLNKAIHDEDKWQPITKYKARVGDDVHHLLEAISEINLYLPDDWRMTRSRNNFRILVVPRTGKLYLLVGSSYRTNDDNILHVIDSIFQPHFFDQHDLQEIFGDKEQKIDDKLRRKYDEILKPNLYYFQQCPDDSQSPLFARQYEKEKVGVDGIVDKVHYHRIHPLYRWGLDLDHYKWIKWDIEGKAEFVDYTGIGYHGKDYWKVPHINGTWRGSFESYVESQMRILGKYNVVEFKMPEQASSSYEQEFKFLPNPQHAKGAMKNVMSFLEKEGFTLLKCGSREQVDTYFDDDDFHLYKRGISFRFRETKGSARITLKMRPYHHSETKSAAEYRRIEEEATISKAQRAALFRGERINAYPCRLIPYVVPEFGNIRQAVTVKTTRELVELSNKAHQKAEICFDTVMYEMDGKMVGPDFEIEIESKGFPRKELKEITTKLKMNLNLIPATESKYERAIIFCKKS